MNFNIFKKKKTEASLNSTEIGSIEVVEEKFDPKQMIVPQSSDKAEIIEYFVFCKDDKAEKDKLFPYHKRVVCDCRNWTEAENMAKVFTVHYQHYALAYNVTKHDIVNDVHEGSKKLFLARIKEFREGRAERSADRIDLASLITANMFKTSQEK